MTSVRSTAEHVGEAADRERDRVAWNLPRTRNEHGARLDWDAFVAGFFPGSRRHDLKALVAYAAYRRSGAVAKHSTVGGGASDEAERISAQAGIKAWEDEGGAAR